MALKLIYKNDLGEVEVNGAGNGFLRICELGGLGPVQNSYATVAYTGQNGQKTVSKKAEPRGITLKLEVFGNNILTKVREALRILCNEGTLYIQNEDTDRRIFCNQVNIPDVERVLSGRISTFAVQFVCDNPFFEDGTDTVVPLYQRVKLIESPFTLPAKFGSIVTGASLENKGDIEAEPRITLHYPDAVEGDGNIVLANATTGKNIVLNYAPQADDIVTIDVKNRKITSSVSGNLLNNLSNDCFLGDFVLVRGINRVELDLGDATPDFTIECRYSNNYQEAVIV